MKNSTRKQKLVEMITKLEDKYNSYNYDYKHSLTYIEEKQGRIDEKLKNLNIELIMIEDSISESEASDIVKSTSIDI